MMYTVVTRSSRLNVRSGPGIRFPRVGTRRSGDIVEVSYSNNGWARFKRGGWASLDFLRPVTSAQTTAAPIRATPRSHAVAADPSPPPAGPPMSTGIPYSYYSARRGIVLSPRHNRATKHDATGAFIPGARAFTAWHRTVRFPELTLFDNAHDVSGAGRRTAREEAIAAIRGAPGPLGIIAYFGHGTSRGLPSAGIGEAHIDELADAIRANSTDEPVVLLYACSAGTMGGFAERLQRAIGKGVVYSHSTPGHTFRNPYVTRFPEKMYVVDPGSDLFRSWQRKLHTESLWLRFWMFSVERLQSTIEAGIDTRRVVAR